jgi:multidrug resistance efflux pump
MAEEIRLEESPSSTTEAPPVDGASANGGGGRTEAPPPNRLRRQITAVRNSRVRMIVFAVVAVLIVVAAVIGVNYWLNSLWYVSTDNAQVTGTPVPVGSLSAGRVESIDVQVGSAVHKGDVVARVVLPTTVSSALVREGVMAPFDGTIIAIPVGVGATVMPGQSIVTMVDPSTLYVNANVDETAVRRVAVGQRVDVHLDALNQDVAGEVEGITPASAGTFSLLPQDNTSGSFTKVAQLVPVKISIDVPDRSLLVGTSAEVRIHVANR